MQKFTVLTLPNLLKVLQWLGYLLAGLTAISALFLALLLLINLPVFDEDLHPDLAALASNEVLPAPDGNAYAGLMGLRATPGQDFVATGHSLLQRYLDNRAAGNDRLTETDYEELLGPDPLTTGLLPEETCRSSTSVCSLEQLSGMMQQGDYDRARMDLVLQRYDALIALPALRPMAIVTFMTPAPNYQTARDAQKYSLATSYNTGSSNAFLHQVAADLKFWRMAVRNGPWLLDKMIAIAALWADMQMLSEYIALHELSAEDRALIAGFLVPLTPEELDIGEAYMAEAQLMHNTLEFWHAHPESSTVISNSRLQLQLTLINATANQNYTRLLQPFIAMSKLSAGDYARALATPEFQAALRQRSGLSPARRSLGLSPRNLYNLGGKLLLKDPNWPGAHTYIGRMHDINAMMLAVKLQFELNGTPREQLPEALRRASNTPPYSGVRFNYDAEAGWLTFECFDPPSRNNLRCRAKL